MSERPCLLITVSFIAWSFLAANVSAQVFGSSAEASGCSVAIGGDATDVAIKDVCGMPHDLVIRDSVGPPCD